MKIAVLMGGNSGERDVSLASGAGVARALREAGHEVVAWDTARGPLGLEEEEELLRSGVGTRPPPRESLDFLDTGNVTTLSGAPEMEGVDVIFLALHGGSGEDGTVQTLLDLTGIPYAGSGRVGAALSMDKDLSKRILRDGGILTPDWVTAPAGAVSPEEVVARLGLPVIVKPPCGGSTLGLTLAHDFDELRDAIVEAAGYEEQVLFECFTPGRELTVGVVGDEALPVGEIIPKHEIFDYECKYQPGMAQEIFPAVIGERTAERLQSLALQVHRLLRLSDFSRVDFIVDRYGVPWCLEANALPGLTANSLLPKAAQAAGIAFPELCERIARLALDRTHAALVARRDAGREAGRAAGRKAAGGAGHEAGREPPRKGVAAG